MTNYRAVVEYNFKNGMEEQGLRFLENELLKKAQQLGCHTIELLQNERKPTHVVGIATWNNIAEARAFQKRWDSKEKELTHLCSNIPMRSFYKIKTMFNENMRKTA